MSLIIGIKAPYPPPPYPPLRVLMMAGRAVRIAVKVLGGFYKGLNIGASIIPNIILRVPHYNDGIVRP